MVHKYSFEKIIQIINIFEISGVYFTFTKYLDVRNKEAVRIDHQPNLVSLAKSYFEKPETWLGMFIILAVVLTVIFLIILVLRKRIVVAIALIKEGSK